MPSGGEDEGGEGGGNKFFKGTGDHCNGTHHHADVSSPSHHHHSQHHHQHHPERKICGVAAISVGADSGILGDINPSMSTLNNVTNNCCSDCGTHDRKGRKGSNGRKGGQSGRDSRCKKKHCEDHEIKSHEVSPLLNKNTAPSTYGSGNNLNHQPTPQSQLWTVKV